MRRVFRVAYAVGMISASMMPATAQAPAPAIAPDTGKISQAWWASYFKDSRLVVLADGRKLNLLCQGSGGPVVVLESGLGSGAWAWRILQPMLSAHTKVCSYDRAGYGLSPPTELSRSAGSEAYDLAQLLDGAKLPGHTSWSDIRWEATSCAFSRADTRAALRESSWWIPPASTQERAHRPADFADPRSGLSNRRTCCCFRQSHGDPLVKTQIRSQCNVPTTATG